MTKKIITPSNISPTPNQSSELEGPLRKFTAGIRGDVDMIKLNQVKG